MKEKALRELVARMRHAVANPMKTWSAGEVIAADKVDFWADEIEALLAEQAPAGELTFDKFSRINRQRCESSTGFNHQLSSWSTSDWFLALLGELGEAANIAKKLNRVRDGIPGNKVSADELQVKLRQELGDAFVYLDLLCQSLGVAIGDAAVEVFNAKSQEISCLITIATGRSSQPVGESAWLIERRDAGVEYAYAWSGGFDWTKDSLKAIRFCRREDANQVAEIFEFEDVHICEHQWVSSQPAEPRDPAGK